MHRRLIRLLCYSLMAVVPVLGAVASFGPAAGARTVQASPGAQAAAAARAALKQLVIGQHGTDHAVSKHVAAINGLSQVDSTNWSGYADDNSGGNTYSQVSGNWIEPSASCTSTESLAAFWVGIDGYSSGSVEQDGTLIECYRSRAYYYTWWEMYPSNSIQVVGGSLRPGDSISASVVRSGGYTLKVTDSTHSANSFSTTQTCSSCANSSAEWIAEAPSGSSGVYPLSDFHSWSTSGASVTSGSAAGDVSSFPDDELTMIDSSGAVKAQPGTLSGGGSSFTVTWDRSS
jgi:Peptidase A4 family